MRLNKKSMLFSLGMMLTLFIAVMVVLAALMRHYTLESVQQQSRQQARLLLHQKVLLDGHAPTLRQPWKQHLKRMRGLEGIHIFRGEAVQEQYGAGPADVQPLDTLEKTVLATGEAALELEYRGLEPVFRYVMPWTMNIEPSLDCSQCHQGTADTILGGVSITTTMPALSEGARSIFMAIGSIFVVFTAGLLWTIHRFTTPIVQTARDIHKAVKKAISGDFRSQVMPRSDDEIGEIAKSFNTLTLFLNRDLHEIRTNVAQLLRCENTRAKNLLASTTRMVDGLIEVSQFKQTIEGDEHRTEVYRRLARVISEDFLVPHHSIYEVDHNKKRIVPMLLDGEPSDNVHWCDPQIQVRAESCRACRTGQIICNLEEPEICPCFRTHDETHTLHLCIPIIQSGRVGSLVQLIFRQEEAEELMKSRPILEAYLREAAPVLEAKRLMDTLKETTLRDSMTGLHNRRFLEEFMETLVAGHNRRKARIGVLMLDVDYFKKVNDTLGHQAGDELLKNVARILVNAVRASDLVIRYGGEEFLILLQDIQPQSLEQVAEKIRASVEKHKFHLAGQSVQKTISIGAALLPDDGDTLWQVIKFADVALYQAKEQGRNRVVRFTADMWQQQDEY